MPIEYCESCGAEHEWNWEEAFDKFGFNDGDGLVMTQEVEDTLQSAGYETASTKWGLHNVLITSIKKDGEVIMTTESKDYSVGYDNPRNYLPKEIINLLDEEFEDE